MCFVQGVSLFIVHNSVHLQASPPPANSDVLGVSMHLQRQQCGRAGCIHLLYTVSSVDVQGVSIYTASSVDVQGVSFYTASCMCGRSRCVHLRRQQWRAGCPSTPQEVWMCRVCPFTLPAVRTFKVCPSKQPAVWTKVILDMYAIIRSALSDIFMSQGSQD